MIHRKKNRPALQRRDILTVSLVSSCFRNLLRSSSSSHVLVVLFVLAFNTARFSLKHFFLWLFFRSLSLQLFFLVALLFLVLNVTAFCYVDFF